MPPANPALRVELEAERLRIGVIAQHARLAAVDPVTAARLHPNDSHRVQRALEIHALSGRPASAWHAEPTAGSRVPGRVLRYAVSPPDKDAFDARIQGIVDNWPQQVDGSRAVAIGVPQPPALEEIVSQYLDDFGPR